MDRRSREREIFEVFQICFDVGFFCFHDWVQKHARRGARSESEIWNDQGKREQERERAANGAILVWKDHEVTASRAGRSVQRPYKGRATGPPAKRKGRSV